VVGSAQFQVEELSPVGAIVKFSFIIVVIDSANIDYSCSAVKLQAMLERQYNGCVSYPDASTKSACTTVNLRLS
jgi:hypothetical protein